MLYLRKKLLKEFAKDKDYRKARDHCHYTGKYGGAVFHNGSSYDYYFII